jgi:hypothetical protein
MARGGFFRFCPTRELMALCSSGCFEMAVGGLSGSSTSGGFGMKTCTCFLCALLCGWFLLVVFPTSIKAQAVGGGAGTKENLDLPFDALGEVQDEEDAPEIVTFYGQQLEGDGFFYVIDKSGSMNNAGELDAAKKEVVRNISEFSDRVQFGIVFFSSEVNKFPSSGVPADASPGMKQSAINFTQSTQSTSGSCIQKGMSEILRMANQATSKRKVIVYLGDGGGTCGSDEQQYLKQTLALVASQNYQRIQINTIGVLQEINEAFLKQLATSNGGTFTRITR